MSAGSGFHSITGDWQFEDYSRTGVWDFGRNQGKQKYESRKIAVYGEHFDLMGFVKLTAISEEEKEKERLAREAIARSKQKLNANREMNKND